MKIDDTIVTMTHKNSENWFSKELPLNVIDEIEYVTIFMDYKNDFEFGVDAIILVSQDTNDFKNGLADTLTQITIQPDSSSLDSISLSGLF